MPRKSKTIDFTGARECVVCHTMDTTATGKIPLCKRCQEVAPLDLLTMDPTQQKRALVLMGIGFVIQLLKPKTFRGKTRRR